MTLTHGSLFSGIGGFDLAAKWMGWENTFQVEKDIKCRRILAKNFPDVTRFEDIKDFNADEYTGAIDIISGGFPCQPFSVAGLRKGKDDDRYLWQEMLRIISTVKPTYVVGENVTGIIGMALDQVLSDLEAQGYTTETFVIPACGKNAWHRRDRVWIVAYTHSSGRTNEQKENRQPLHNGNRNNTIEKQGGKQQQCWPCKSGSILPHSSINREQEGIKNCSTKQPYQNGSSWRVVTNCNNPGCKEQQWCSTNGKEYFAPKCAGWWEVEPRVGRVVNGLPNRVDRLKGLGNAIVPQIAYEIFTAIENYHNNNQ